MTLRTDENGQLACADLFPPNSVFQADRQPDGTIRLEKLNGDVPTVETFRTPEGFVKLPAKLDRKKITAAIRADRDSQ